jgi:hypothetical protein
MVMSRSAAEISDARHRTLAAARAVALECRHRVVDRAATSALEGIGEVAAEAAARNPGEVAAHPARHRIHPSIAANIGRAVVDAPRDRPHVVERGGEVDNAVAR